MADAYTTIRRVEFIFEDDLSFCNLYYTSTEPGTPWGGGWKTTAFAASRSIVDFVEKETHNFLSWENGRYTSIKDEESDL